VKAPPNREFAANRKRRGDRPVHEHAARHPCQPPTNKCPICRANADYLRQPLPKIGRHGRDNSDHEGFDRRRTCR
jgi:hypothetical protein